MPRHASNHFESNRSRISCTPQYTPLRNTTQTAPASTSTSSSAPISCARRSRSNARFQSLPPIRNTTVECFRRDLSAKNGQSNGSFFPLPVA